MAYADARYIWTAYHIGKSCKKLVEIDYSVRTESFYTRPIWSGSI